MSDQDGNIQFQIKSKKKNQKKGQNVPFNQLGFRPKVYYDCYQSKPKKFIGKFKKFNNQKVGKDNYLSRLTFIVDANQLTSQQVKQFKGVKKSQWDKTMQVIIRSRDKIQCCICLTQQIVAPQMTKCGHVYCFHCILMHFQKSLRNNKCPVCNEFIDDKQIKSCKPIFEPQLNKQEEISMQLKIKKNNNKIYFPQTLQEDIRCAKVIRMLRNGILNIFNEQCDQLSVFIKKNEHPQYQDYIVKAMSLCDHKIQKFRQATLKQNLKFGFNEIISNDCIVQSFDDGNQNTQVCKFYQQKSGRNVFLHPITERYMSKNIQIQKWPLSLDLKIFDKQQFECTVQNNKKNKYLSHLPLNTDVQVVLVELDNFIDDQKVLSQYKKQLDIYRKAKLKQQEQQRIQSERLSLIYEKEQEYMKKLKEMTRQQFYDINVPPVMDPSEINEETFPSLNGGSSVQSSSKNNNDVNVDYKDIPNKLLMTASSPSSNQNKNLKIKKVNEINEDDFPDLSANTGNVGNLTIKTIKSEAANTNNNGKNKKKRKKDKFIDVTKQFFNQDDQQYD